MTKLNFPKLHPPNTQEKKYLEKIMFPYEEIINLSENVISQLNHHTPNIDTVLCVMNGAYYWTNLLLHKINYSKRVDIDISFYHSTQIKKTQDHTINKKDFSNKHVLITENIVATGRTLSYIIKQILPHKPKTITVSTLVNNKSVRLPEFTHINQYLQTNHFECKKNEFLVGFGIRGLKPLPEKLRYLNSIYLVKSTPQIYYSYLNSQHHDESRKFRRPQSTL